LAERRILVSGGSSGIGFALAKALAPQNTVVIAGRDERRLEEARASTSRLQALGLDVTAEDDARRAIEGVEEHLGGLDLLINSAGVFGSGAFDDPEAERAAQADVEVNLLGSVRMTRLALPPPRRSDGGGAGL